MGTVKSEATGLESIHPSLNPARDARHFREIVAAVDGVHDADARLRRAVADARVAGESWTVIGAALGTSRQNAQQRFGRSAED